MAEMLLIKYQELLFMVSWQCLLFTFKYFPVEFNFSNKHLSLYRNNTHDNITNIWSQRKNNVKSLAI